jgi:hypothetical protein
MSQGTVHSQRSTSRFARQATATVEQAQPAGGAAHERLVDGSGSVLVSVASA